MTDEEKKAADKKYVLERLRDWPTSYIAMMLELASAELRDRAERYRRYAEEAERAARGEL